MIRYNVRSRYLVDVVNDIKAGKYILAPYFQRKLVWRDAHKVDFIETILLQFPFPEIFIARGDIDVDRMTSTSCVVDGQQRLNAIRQFIDGEIEVKGRKYGALTSQEKESFLKYEIAIIDLDLSHNDTLIIEMFKRLNRTFYALSFIEKQATEFASSEFMMVAKLLCGELRRPEEATANIDPDLSSTDPNITPAFVEWANRQDINQFRTMILDSNIFSKYEISRMVHLSFTLNLMATALSTYYTRNEKVAEFLENYEDKFPEKDDLIKGMNETAKFIRKRKILKSKFWSAKSNVFTLFLALFEVRETFSSVDEAALTNALKAFETKPPEDYALAAREGVNNKQERLIRYTHVKKLIKS